MKVPLPTLYHINASCLDLPPEKGVPVSFIDRSGTNVIIRGFILRLESVKQACQTLIAEYPRRQTS